MNAVSHELTTLRPIGNAKLEPFVLVCSTNKMSEHGGLTVRTEATPSY